MQPTAAGKARVTDALTLDAAPVRSAANPLSPMPRRERSRLGRLSQSRTVQEEMAMIRFRSTVVTVALAAVVLFASAPGHASGERSRFAGLAPGKFVVQKQTVPVRVVLIGFGAEVDTAAIRSRLPATYKPVVRVPRFYGLPGRNMGLEYQFSYRLERASAGFANQLFSFLKAAGTPGPVAPFQQAYNAQVHNILNVTGPVLYIDAPTVEKWLAENQEGENDDNGYTIFFINWYGRPDFQFHVYTKTDEPDPDTNYNFGVRRGSRKMIAWGGKHSRNWFYDFSAGPESWGGNWNVDAADLDGDSVADYRIPPIWEYAASGYRKPALLGADMGRLVRFVGIDLLFTTSPLYDPLASSPDAGGRKVAHVAMLEDEPGASGLDWIHVDAAERAWKGLQPYYRWKVGLTDNNPIDAGAKRALDIFSGALVEDDCWNTFGTTFAELFCYFDANLRKYVPSYGRRDSVGGVFTFNTNVDVGFLGFADDNWVDGTPSYEFVVDNTAIRNLGYGITTTVTHEFGHHVGMSHPHDGYDFELDLDYGSSASLYFAWDGDESDTVMHYLALSGGFGRFDQDNMSRWQTAGYLNWANALAGDILASPDADRVMPAVEAADDSARRAKGAFAEREYVEAARAAREAYATLKQAAASIGLKSMALEQSRRLAAQSMRPRKEGCRPRFLTE
jgi:hypothetical protein